MAVGFIEEEERDHDVLVTLYSELGEIGRVPMKSKEAIRLAKAILKTPNSRASKGCYASNNSVLIIDTKKLATIKIDSPTPDKISKEITT